MTALTVTLARSLANTAATKGEAHFARPAGSSLVGVNTMDGEAVYAFLLEAALTGGFEEVTEEARATGCAFGRCRYFRATLPEGVIGLERIALLSELDEADLARVRVVKGHHGGLELQLPGGVARETRVVHVLVGDPASATNEVADDTAIVYTWYPGRLTPPVVIAGATVKFV